MTESVVQSVEFSPAGSLTPDLCVYHLTHVLWDPSTDRRTGQRVPRAADVLVSGRVESVLVNVRQTDRSERTNPNPTSLRFKVCLLMRFLFVRVFNPDEL